MYNHPSIPGLPPGADPKYAELFWEIFDGMTPQQLVEALEADPLKNVGVEPPSEPVVFFTSDAARDFRLSLPQPSYAIPCVCY